MKVKYSRQFLMTNLSITLIGFFTSVLVYLFATAPPQLPDVAQEEKAIDRPIDVANLFNAMNAINDSARQIYTSKIVGAGKEAGLEFGEEWADPDVEKGPLPALYLRLVASRMETKSPPLGLYLGSDQPINRSNLFSAAQSQAFLKVKAQRTSVFIESTDSGFIAMYPDLASAKPCVTCHNDHADSPKKDWVLNDVMGATTWTYPRKTLGAAEYLEVTEAFYSSVREAYQLYLDKASEFSMKISVGNKWPDEEQRSLPDADTFMALVRSETAVHTLNHLVLQADAKFSESSEIMQ